MQREKCSNWRARMVSVWDDKASVGRSYTTVALATVRRWRRILLWGWRRTRSCTTIGPCTSSNLKSVTSIANLESSKYYCIIAATSKIITRWWRFCYKFPINLRWNHLNTLAANTTITITNLVITIKQYRERRLNIKFTKWKYTASYKTWQFREKDTW